MATYSSIRKTHPKLQSIFGLLTPFDDTEIRNVLNKADIMLLEYAKFIGAKRVGWENTGFELIWFPSGQIEISSFVETGLDSAHCVSFNVSLQPTWVYRDFPTEPEWEIEAEIYADCQHQVYCGNMHRVHKLPPVTKTRPIDAVTALYAMTAELIKMGKEKPLDYWLQLAGDNQA